MTKKFLDQTGLTYLIQQFDDYPTNEILSAVINGIDEAKQDALVSGTNIKTINNTSILGEGDISISGSSVDIATTSTAGIVKPDGETITIDADGTITAENGGSISFEEIAGENTPNPLAIEYGGTGATSASDARTALGAAAVSHTHNNYLTSHQDISGKADVDHSHSNYKTIQTAQSSPSANGNATAFIDSIVQDTNGVITATKKNITAADLGLSKAMKFLGITTTALSDGLTTAAVTIGGSSVTPSAGDVVLNNDTHLEFIWSGTYWELLGGDSSYALSNHNHNEIYQPIGNYKTTQTVVADPTASGDTVTFIDTITQNANGVITATKKTVSNASTGAAGLMSSTDKTKLDGIASGANAYTLPTASTSTLGGVKIDGTTITINDGVISASNQIEEYTTNEIETLWNSI